MSEPRLPDLAALRQRAEYLRRIRDFFHARDVLEVETPVLSRGISLDCHIDPFSVRYHALGHPGAGPQAGDATYYLQTSPEPHMKRLLCLGFPDIWQMGKAFRNGERGARHNPEFTMLEWYRKGFSLADLMEEVEALCRLFQPEVTCVRLSWREAMAAALSADPIDMTREEILALPALAGRLPGDGTVGPETFPARADLLDFIMAHIVEPELPSDKLVFVHAFPAEQAAQAQLHAEDARVAHRFEVYGQGLELGNGYLELADPEEYARRFEGENAKRRNRGKPELPKDTVLLADLRRGLPPCAGVAMGVDRLVQWGMGLAALDPILAFPWEQA